MDIQAYTIKHIPDGFQDITGFFENNNIDLDKKYILNIEQESFSFIEKIVYDITLYHCKKNKKNIDEILIEFYLDFSNSSVICQNQNQKNKLFLSCMTIIDNYLSTDSYNVNNENNFECIFTNLTYDDYKYKKFDEQTYLVNNLNKISLVYLNKNLHLVFDGNKIQSFIKPTENNNIVLFINLWESLNDFKNKKMSNEHFSLNNKINIFNKNEEKIIIKELDSSNSTPFGVENILNSDFYENILYKKEIKNMLYFVDLLQKEEIIAKNIILNIHDNFKVSSKILIDELIHEKVGNLVTDIENLNKEIFTYNNRFLQRFKHKNIISQNICKWIIDESEKYALNNGGWTSDNFENHKTLDIKLEKMSNIFEYFLNFEMKNILETIQKDYCLPNNTEFIVITLNIIKYTKGIQAGVNFHRDDGFITFNICLNDDFEGGGTLFEDGLLMILNKGDMIIHSAKTNHKGVPILSGERYILIGFVKIKIDIPIDKKN